MRNKAISRLGLLTIEGLSAVSAILEFDWTVGEIIKVLEKNKLREKTILIISSDNGPVIDDGYHDQAVSY